MSSLLLQRVIHGHGNKRIVEGIKNSTEHGHAGTCTDKLRTHSNTFDDFRKKQEVIAIISKVKVRSKRDMITCKKSNKLCYLTHLGITENI